MDTHQLIWAPPRQWIPTILCALRQCMDRMPTNGYPRFCAPAPTDTHHFVCPCVNGYPSFCAPLRQWILTILCAPASLIHFRLSVYCSRTSTDTTETEKKTYTYIHSIISVTYYVWSLRSEVLLRTKLAKAWPGLWKYQRLVMHSNRLYLPIIVTWRGILSQMEQVGLSITHIQMKNHPHILRVLSGFCGVNIIVITLPLPKVVYRNIWVKNLKIF